MPSPAFTAALDIGTNSVVLLLLRRDADGVLRRVLEPARITRLGEDTARTGVLKPQAMERTLAAVAELMRGLREVAPHGTGAAAATSAVRDAANGAEFLGRCAEIIGGQPALFSGREEADTMFRGATDGLPPGTRCLCADIGGGSTELAAGEPGRCTARTSLNLGCVRLGETHSLLSRATPADIAAARQAAAELLRGACQGMASSHPLTPLEGAGGTDLFSTAGVAECAGGSGDGVPATRGTPADSATPGLKENRGGATLQRGSGGGENGLSPISGGS